MSKKVLERAAEFCWATAMGTVFALGVLGCGSRSEGGGPPVDGGAGDTVLDAPSREGSASDGTPSDASPPDASADGCAPSSEATTDGGCVAVAPAGGRALAMEVNPPSGLDYATEVSVASNLGVTLVPVTLPWSTLESAAPVGGQSQIDTSLFADLATVYSTGTVSLLISIPLVDTASIEAPPDLQPGLASGALALDDPSVITRYETLLDSLFANLGAVKVRYLLVANEENTYLSAKPEAMWTALASFFGTIKTYVAGKHPGVVVGMSLAFEGLLDSTAEAQIATLFASSDDVFVTYYLGDNGFGGVSSTTVPADMDTMVTFAGTRPVILKECGYATGTTGHTEAGQVAFITDLFQAWDTHVAEVPVVTISRMFDDDESDCTSEAQAYGAAGNQDFIAFLCTLGVRSYADVPKLAWARLADAAAWRGF
jgi:hypothetical protein